jgi:Tfp pilus assembly protein PilO
MAGVQFKKQFIIGALAVLLIADAGLGYLNTKMSGPRTDREQTLAAQTQKIALVKADINRAREIRDKTPQVLRQFDGFESALLPASKGYSVITQEIGDYAREAHLLLDETRFHEKDVTGRDLMELTMESRVGGDYNGIVSFLNHLQRSKNVYIVDSLDVETENTAQGPAGALRVNLKVRTYLRKG